MAEENTNENVQNVEIKLGTLETMRQILDLASSRGAFRGSELKVVGEVYDKLDAFLKHIEAIQSAENAPTGPAEQSSGRDNVPPVDESEGE